MKEIETKYVDENPDTNIAKETKKIDIIKEHEIKKPGVNYDFVVKSLKENIGVEIDDFFKINIGQKITRYNADSFTRIAITALEKSRQEIIAEFKKILTNNIE